MLRCPLRTTLQNAQTSGSVHVADIFQNVYVRFSRNGINICYQSGYKQKLNEQHSAVVRRAENCPTLRQEH